MWVDEELFIPFISQMWSQSSAATETTQFLDENSRRRDERLFNVPGSILKHFASL